MTLPEHVSHSQLSSWSGRCQKEVQLQRIQGAPATPAWWLVGGSAVHEVTEELDRRGLEFNLTPAVMNVKLEVEELFEAKLEQLARKEEQDSGAPRVDWIAAGVKPRQDGNYWREKGPQMVGNWLDWRTRTGWEIAQFEIDGDLVPGIELKLETELTLTQPVRSLGSMLTPAVSRKVKGAPDRVMVLPNGELVVVDVKSGSTTPSTPLQQGGYATQLEKLGHRRPRYGTFVKVGPRYGGAHTSLAPLAKYDERYFEHLFTAYRAQIETGTFLPNVGDFCDRCGVQGFCYAAGGLQSAQYDPLDPNYQGAK